LTDPLPPALIDALKLIDSPTISNAIEPFNIRGRHEGYLGPEIECRYPEEGVMAGYAVTAKIVSIADDADTLKENRFAFFDAINNSPKPAVCVIQDISGNPGRASQWGEMMMTSVKVLGAVGVVTDGAIRDIEEIREIGGVQFFSPYVCVSHGQLAMVEVGTPVTISGCEINPGDLLHGDINGVVKIPHSIAEKMPEAVEEIRKREGGVLNGLKPGMSMDEFRKVWDYR